MKNVSRSIIAACVLAGLYAPTLFAQDGLSNVRFSGYGQFAVGVPDGNTANLNLGYGDNEDFNEESLFALQVDAPINDRVDVTAQFIARGREDYNVELAWAYANVRLWEGGSMKLGRQRAPFFLYSDYLDVGYAYRWLRTPNSVYYVPFENYDGVSFSDRRALGNWYSQAQVFYGQFDGDFRLFAQNFDSQADQLTGFSWEGTYNDWLTLRASYVQADITIDVPILAPLLGSLNQFGFSNTAAALDYNEDKGTFKGVGFRVDRGNWLVDGEYTQVEIKDSLLAPQDNWYVSGGYRIGKFTPYVTYGEASGDPRTEYLPGVATLPPPLQLPVTGAILNDRRDDRFYSAGVRWDFAPSAALKLDYTEVDSKINDAADGSVAGAALVFTF